MLYFDSRDGYCLYSNILAVEVGYCPFGNKLTEDVGYCQLCYILTVEMGIVCLVIHWQ